MDKINCIIVDDEPFALDLMEGYVKKTPFLELKAKCRNAKEVTAIINEENIQLVFLDIQMPDTNGVDLSKTLPTHIKVVFTTAFKNYAFDGFKVNAVDYLLKPFNYQEFLSAANKASRLLLPADTRAINSADKSFIFVKSEYKHIKIKLEDVFYFEGLKDYVKIWMSSQPKPILTLMSLKSLEQELSSDNFMRVHRSFIIALNKIDSVERGRVRINNEFITIAEQYKSRFQEFIENKLIS